MDNMTKAMFTNTIQDKLNNLLKSKTHLSAQVITDFKTVAIILTDDHHNDEVFTKDYFLTDSDWKFLITHENTFLSVILTDYRINLFETIKNAKINHTKISPVLQKRLEILEQIDKVLNKKK